MYLPYRINLDIAFIDAQLSKPNADPCIGHLKVVKKMVYYLKDTIYFGLTYSFPLQSIEQTKALIPIGNEPHDLIGYANSNYVGDPKD